MQFGGSATKPRRRRSGLVRKAIAVASAFALSLGLGAVGAAAAHAADGIDVSVLHNNAVVENGAAVPEGADLTLRVQYDSMAGIAGQRLVITLPEAVDAPTDLPTNEAIESIEQGDNGKITVTFKDPLPEDTTEGAFAIKVKTSRVDSSVEAPITWQIGDQEHTLTFTVTHTETPPVTVEDGYAKSVSPNNLNGYVLSKGAPDFGFDGLNPEIADQALTYTLKMTSAEAREDFVISDVIAGGLSYDPDSFSATVTANGESSDVAFTPEISGQTFAGRVTVPAQSELTITYRATVSDVQRLESDLRARFDRLDGQPGNYDISLKNTASFGPHERSATVLLRGNVPGVGIGNNFAKSGNWTQRDVIADPEGELQPAADMTYTLRANLKPWNGQNPNFTLRSNVVISDTLIEQAAWLTGDDAIAITGSGPLSTLKRAEFTGTAAEFADDEYVGQYAISGQTLLVNVGKDNATDVRITAKAQLRTVAGLPGSDNTTVVGGERFPWRNTAVFTYNSVTTERSHDATVTVLPPDYPGGVDDSAAFSKTTPSGEVSVKPGERAEIPYRFAIDTAKPNIDPLTARITDEVDHEVFDLSDVATLPVSGSYGDTALGRDDFSVALDDKQRLVIELSDAGRDRVATLDAGQEWVVDIVLTTVPFDGKQTFEVYNFASFESDGSEWHYVSEETTEATSYGDEAEMRKRIYSADTDSWVEHLNAPITDGEFVDDEFVYSIELIPRGSYGADFPVTIFPREDVLPDSVEFLGFIVLDEDGEPRLEDPSQEPQDMNGNVSASFADGTVSIAQNPDTSLNRDDGRIVVYFAVRATDASGDIVNSIAGSTTTITPVGDPSITVEKWNDEGETPEYDAAGNLTNAGFAGDFDAAPGKELSADSELPIHFTVSNNGREALTSITVTDELTAGAGEITDLVCTFPDDSRGTEWAGPFAIGAQFSCAGTLPGLAAGDTHSDLATVSGVGEHSKQTVTDDDPWHAFVEAADEPESPGTTPPSPGTPGTPGTPGGATPGGTAPNGSGASPLAATGSDASFTLAAALALLVAGGAAVGLRLRLRARRGGAR